MGAIPPPVKTGGFLAVVPMNTTTFFGLNLTDVDVDVAGFGNDPWYFMTAIFIIVMVIAIGYWITFNCSR